MKFNINITVEASNGMEASNITMLLQNIADNTDKDTKLFLCNKVKKNSKYFANIAEKLKNPIIQKMIG
jgi:hypothetical protein